jgi:Nif-specific regulatory protein
LGQRLSGEAVNMPSVIISRESQFEKVVPLQEKTLIGRSPANDIVLEEPGISRNHARIEQQNDLFFLIDDGSTNGTFIEDRRVGHQQLTHRTSFRIQNYLLTFVEDLIGPDQPRPDIDVAGPMEDSSQKMLKTLWFKQQAKQKRDLHYKVNRILNMVTDLYNADDDVDPISLALDAAFDITGAKRGIVALKKEGADFTFTHFRGFEQKGQEAKVSKTIFQQVLDSGSSVHLRSAEWEDPTKSVCKHGLKSILCVPLVTVEKTIGCLYLDHPDYSSVFTETDRDLLMAVAAFIAENFLSDKSQPGSLVDSDNRLARELLRHGVIAKSPVTLKVFRDSQIIARYNVSVLIYGETGTGKELIARYIHDQSGRKGKFIARNCSAIASTMFESELFGHEKGAFTGATEKKLGILELAHLGTIFLDEVGDMPIELQAKMLRALQENEIWRVGGTSPVKIDVRVIAATHKDIKNQRKKHNFRDDLYYRLANVEITAPSLRERPEDIAPLCEMILQSFCQEHPKGDISLILSSKALKMLETHNWPGNIRELRNTLIQTSLKCDGTTIEPRHLKGLIDVSASPSKSSGGPLPSLMEVERVHIIKVLKSTNGNKSAAAKVLSIDRNRLNRRLKTLGIDSENIK